MDRSDVVVQILDARNPLLFRNEDLEDYVRKLSDDKINVLLMNKADLLSEKQRNSWAEYFNERNIRVVFWSAIDADVDSIVNKVAKVDIDDDEGSENSSESESGDEEDEETIVEEEDDDEDYEDVDSDPENDTKEDKIEPTAAHVDDENASKLNSAKLLTRDDLIIYLKNLKSLVKSSKNDVFTVGKFMIDCLKLKITVICVCYTIASFIWYYIASLAGIMSWLVALYQRIWLMLNHHF